MKRSITISIILLLLLILSILGILYIKQTTESISHFLDQAAIHLENKDFTAAQEVFLNVQVKWKKSGDIINTYVNHRDIDLIEEQLKELYSSAEQKDVSKCLTLISIIKFRLHHIYESELPLLKNIF